MSGSRETAACYRLYAVNCIELAEQVCELDRRVFLLHMAKDWLRMADQLERVDADAPADPEPASQGSDGHASEGQK
ncbi:MAG: hypothetical protein WBD71_02345 [Xanthobacteraceae bacterium]